MSENQPVDVFNNVLEAAIFTAHGMGVRGVELRPGHAAATAPMEGNGNHFGVMYAGVLFTVAEVLGGALALSTFDVARYYPLVKDLRITFLKAARSDVRAEASLTEDEVARVATEAAERGKSDFTLDAVVTDADGTVVATTHGLYQLRAHGR